MADPWTKKGVPARTDADGSERGKKEPVTRPLTPQEIEACEGILAGETPRVAYRRETGNTSHVSFRRFLKNGEVQAYLAARRMEIRLSVMEGADPAEEWLEHVRTAAYWDPADFVLEDIKSPRDILKLPPHVRKLITQMGYDRRGHFTVKFQDRKAAQDMLARFWGLYQADRVNDKDAATNLMTTVFWQFVMSLHVSKGMSLAEAHMLARREPELVEEWGRIQGLLAPAKGEIVVEPQGATEE